MKGFYLSALSLLLFATLGCQKNSAVDTSGVDPIAQQILNDIANGNAQNVYDTYFSAEYKIDMTPKDWKEIATGYQLMFGKVSSVKRLRGSARWIAGQFIEGEVVYSVTWEKGVGEMTLDVTKEDTWKVRQLRISSPQIDERIDKITTELTTQPAK